MLPRSVETFFDRKISFLDSDIGAALFELVSVGFSVCRPLRLTSIFYFTGAISMSVVLVGE